MTLEDYLVLFESMDSYTANNRVDYGKPVLIITVIELIDKGVAYENLFRLNDEIFVKAYKRVWDCCVHHDVEQHPNLDDTFVKLQDDLFWHLSINDDSVANLDEELYDFLQIRSARENIMKFLLTRFFDMQYNSYLAKLHAQISFNGTIYKDSGTIPDGLILLTDRPQWAEILPCIHSEFEEHYNFLFSLLSAEGKSVLSRILPDCESFYINLLLGFNRNLADILNPFKRPLLKIISSLQDQLEQQLGYSCVLNTLSIAKLHIEWLEGVEDDTDYVIPECKDNLDNRNFHAENNNQHCILYEDDTAVYESTGMIVFVASCIYEIQYNNSILSIYEIVTGNEKCCQGKRITMAIINSELYKSFCVDNIDKSIEQITLNETNSFYNVLYDGQWYNHLGHLVGENDVLNENRPVDVDPIIPEGEFRYKPVGRCGKLERYSKSPYVNLLMMALSDEMNRPIKEQPSRIAFEELSFRMIANAWTLLYLHDEKRQDHTFLADCIDNLIKQSENSPFPIHRFSSKDYIFKALHYLPFSGILQDLTDAMMNSTPYSLLRAWIDSNSKAEIMFRSHLFEENCLFAIKLAHEGDYLEINPKKKRMLSVEHDSLILYYGEKFLCYSKR